MKRNKRIKKLARIFKAVLKQHYPKKARKRSRLIMATGIAQPWAPRRDPKAEIERNIRLGREWATRLERQMFPATMSLDVWEKMSSEERDRFVAGCWTPLDEIVKNPSPTSPATAGRPDPTIPSAASGSPRNPGPEVNPLFGSTGGILQPDRTTAWQSERGQISIIEPVARSWRGFFPTPMLRCWLLFLSRILRNAGAFLSEPLQIPSPAPEQIARADARFVALHLRGHEDDPALPK